MTDRENFLGIARRTGYDRMPTSFDMCPSLAKKYNEYTKTHPLKVDSFCDGVPGVNCSCTSSEVFREKYYKDIPLKEGTFIDGNGVAHEPGSEAAFHMTKMIHPMDNFDSVEQILEFPMPVYNDDNLPQMKECVDAIRKNERASVGGMHCTIWETAWYMRGMENLMCDMMSDSDMATVLLDRVTDNAVFRAEGFAKAGADAIFLGDDVGMQHSIMMSISLYDEWIKPRLKRVIDSARAINPDIIVLYHSCGHVTELIPSLIEAGINVLNPVQPECMDLRELNEKFGDKISFHGGIGTQTTMPFGTAEDVRKRTIECLDIFGRKGGLFVCPTHMLEPEVPVENIEAYIKACEDYTK